jgi:hypothetical protein
MHLALQNAETINRLVEQGEFLPDGEVPCGATHAH